MLSVAVRAVQRIGTGRAGKEAVMTTKKDQERTCTVCGGAFTAHDLVAGALVREDLVRLIQLEHPGWTPEQVICREDLARYRAKYVHALLESEKGELSSLELEVLRSIKEHELLSSNVDAQFEREWTFGERLADRIASFGGSWTFLALFGLFILLWIVMNSLVLFWRPADPYPFILLNLVLSCLAAVQPPVIMMSQNRQEAKDRLRSQHDYQVNLKAELEIRQLHEKLDHLLSHQWERLVQIQEVQLDLLSELGRIKWAATAADGSRCEARLPEKKAAGRAPPCRRGFSVPAATSAVRRRTAHHSTS